MAQRGLLVLVVGMLAAGFMACPAPEQQAEQPVAPVETMMTEEEMIADIMAKCICPQCPSWVPEAPEKGEGGDCAVGKSDCIVKEAGCVCPNCPVTLEKGLKWGYYCTRGSAKDMESDGRPVERGTGEQTGE